jgi:hypothetical protein
MCSGHLDGASKSVANDTFGRKTGTEAMRSGGPETARHDRRSEGKAVSGVSF